MSLRVIRPGLLTTVQDRGRFGFQRFGVSCGGALDPVALRLSNLLVGNSPDAPALEITLVGPTLTFEQDTLIALVGATMSAHVGDHPVPAARPVWLQSGATLTLGAVERGARCVLAVAGGIAVPAVMGSYGTHLRAGFGGFHGRALLAGDQIPVGACPEPARRLMSRLAQQAQGRSVHAVSWHIDTPDLPGAGPTTLRVIRGAHWLRQEPQSQQDFLQGSFTVTNQSDRMGYRLSGTTLTLADRTELISEAVCPGTLQLPPQGQPILLMADCATTGGYARIANVIQADLPRAAQLRPGNMIQFAEVSLDEAIRIWNEQEVELQRIGCGIGLQYESA